MKLTLSTLVLFATLLLFGLSNVKGNIVELTASNFESLVLNDNSAWIVQFSKPGCGACERMKPEFIRLASNSNGEFKVGIVNCLANIALERQYVTRGYPTLLIFGANKHSPSQYQAPRTAEAMADAVRAEINNNRQAPAQNVSPSQKMAPAKNAAPAQYMPPAQYGSPAQYGAPPQYRAPASNVFPVPFFPPAQYGVPDQYGAHAQYEAPTQYGPPSQYGSPALYGVKPQYRAPAPYFPPAEYGAPARCVVRVQYGAPVQYGPPAQNVPPAQRGPNLSPQQVQLPDFIQDRLNADLSKLSKFSLLTTLG